MLDNPIIYLILALQAGWSSAEIVGRIRVFGQCRPTFGHIDTIKLFLSQGWLQLVPEKLEGTVSAMPTRDDVQIPVEEQLIVEMCSR